MSSDAPGARKDRPFFGRVEALRGIGALTVAGYHFSGCGAHGFTFLQHDSWPAATPLQHAIASLGLFALPGHAFLMAFFVISGFVLRVSLEHGPQTAPAASARFLIARLFRFYPIVCVAVIVAAVLVPPWTYFDGTARQFAANLLLLDVSMNGHLWALQVELLMVPVILALFFLERRWGPLAVLLIALLTTGLSFSGRWAVFAPLSRNLFAFVLGTLIPTLGRSFATALSRRVATGLIVAAAAVVMTAGPCLGMYTQYASIIEAYVAFAALSIVAYRPDVRGLCWLDGRWVQRLGTASGSYYVLHMATASALMALAPVVIPAAWSAQAPGVVGIVSIAVWLIAIVPLMVCVYHLVEAPGINLGRRVIRSLGLERRAAVRAEDPSRLERRAA